MKSKDKLQVVVLGLLGILVLITTELLICLQYSFYATVGLMVFSIICLELVVVSGRKDDQTELLEKMAKDLGDQSRKIMATESLLAKYKRQIAELTNKNEVSKEALIELEETND